VARALMERGYTLVRPLAGGLEAWIEAGYGVEADPSVEAPSSGSDAPLPA
jgi:3-mercaptopyruvate sulfurtransferase SseA